MDAHNTDEPQARFRPGPQIPPQGSAEHPTDPAAFLTDWMNREFTKGMKRLRKVQGQAAHQPAADIPARMVAVIREVGCEELQVQAGLTQAWQNWIQHSIRFRKARLPRPLFQVRQLFELPSGDAVRIAKAWRQLLRAEAEFRRMEFAVPYNASTLTQLRRIHLVDSRPRDDFPDWLNARRAKLHIASREALEAAIRRIPEHRRDFKHRLAEFLASDGLDHVEVIAEDLAASAVQQWADAPQIAGIRELFERQDRFRYESRNKIKEALPDELVKIAPRRWKGIFDRLIQTGEYRPVRKSQRD